MRKLILLLALGLTCAAQATLITCPKEIVCTSTLAESCVLPDAEHFEWNTELSPYLVGTGTFPFSYAYYSTIQELPRVTCVYGSDPNIKMRMVSKSQALDDAQLSKYIPLNMGKTYRTCDKQTIADCAFDV